MYNLYSKPPLRIDYFRYRKLILFRFVYLHCATFLQLNTEQVIRLECQFAVNALACSLFSFLPYTSQSPKDCQPNYFYSLTDFITGYCQLPHCDFSILCISDKESLLTSEESESECTRERERARREYEDCIPII